MKIYLAGSMAGGRQFEKNLYLIVEVLEELGHEVLTKKNVVQMLPMYSDIRNLKERKAAMKRDKAWIVKSDLFIAEVSTYSHGVGYEHAYAETLGKPVLLLRHKSLKGKKYSVFLDGTDYKKFTFAFYDSKNIKRVLTTFYKKFFNT